MNFFDNKVCFNLKGLYLCEKKDIKVETPR